MYVSIREWGDGTSNQADGSGSQSDPIELGLAFAGPLYTREITVAPRAPHSPLERTTVKYWPAVLLLLISLLWHRPKVEVRQHS